MIWVACIFFASLIVLGGLLYILTGKNEGLPRSSCKVGSKTFQVEVADTPSRRMRGLSFRESLPAGNGMLFVFPFAAKNGFWMKDMNFALDFIWMSDGKVVSIDRNIPPPAKGTSLTALPIYYPASPVMYVLELNAGEAESVQQGDVYTCTIGGSAVIN